MLCSLETLMKNCMFCIIFVPKQSLFPTIYPKDLMRSFECCFLILICMVTQYKEKLKRAKMYKVWKIQDFSWLVRPRVSLSMEKLSMIQNSQCQEISRRDWQYYESLVPDTWTRWKVVKEQEPIPASSWHTLLFFRPGLNIHIFLSIWAENILEL